MPGLFPGLARMAVATVATREQERAGAQSARATRGHAITVAEKLSYLRRRLNSLKPGERIPLGDELVEAAARSRTELVVLFLALLEIIRRNYGVAEQDELFGEIWLKNSSR